MKGTCSTLSPAEVLSNAGCLHRATQHQPTCLASPSHKPPTSLVVEEGRTKPSTERPWHCRTKRDRGYGIKKHLCLNT